MKSSISVSILFVLLISVGKTNAHYVSPYNSSGNLRSSYDRAAEESRNRAIKPYKSEAVPVPTRKTYTPTQTPEPKRQTAEEKAAQILIWERQAKLDLGPAAAKKTNEEAREAELA
ncbi:MAG: hypothetical protein LH615_04625, partial [Ferruginibacter sp.]|nr:hypothetical protein [Ferruginibacter sp.]